MNSRLAISVSAFMLVVFTIYLVPHEIVHVFYDHHDTEHCANTGKQVHLSPIHIHCDFLTDNLPDFIASEQMPVEKLSVELPHSYSCIDVQAVRCIAALRESRGPPMS